MYCSPTKSQNKAEHKSYDMLKALLCLSLAHPGTPLHFSFERQWTQGLRKPNLNSSTSVKHWSLRLWLVFLSSRRFLFIATVLASQLARGFRLSFFFFFFFPLLSLPASSAVTALGPLPPHSVFQSSARLGLNFVKRQSP